MGSPQRRSSWDGGYTSAAVLVKSQQRGIDLVGPVPLATQWPAQVERGYGLDKFEIDWANRQVTCPQGCRSQAWQEHKRNAETFIAATFNLSDCRPCPRRAHCTRATASGRKLLFHARPGYEALRHARQRQFTPEFRALYTVRAGIEGTVSLATNKYDLRHARYTTQAKVQLQATLTAVAINCMRIVAFLHAPHQRHGTPVASFVALGLALGT